jgi:hypothetical protein
MKRILGSLILAGAFLAGCSSDDGGGDCTKTTCAAQNATCGSISDGCGGQLSCGTCGTGLACGNGQNNSAANVCGFAQPSGTVPVNFTIDDTANHVFTQGQLEWKGSMAYDASTRKVTLDPAWAGPTWAVLYDDGPWNTGGHEPIGATAGDHKWGVTVFVAPPATGTTNYEYGAIDRVYQDNFGDGWIWPPGPNGTFAVAAGATAAITASGLTLLAFGDRDIQLQVDENDLASGTWDTSVIQVKSGAWGWSLVTLHDDGSTAGDPTSGDGLFGVTLSSIVGPGHTYLHTGLMHANDKPEFIFVFNGVEYKDPSGNANTQGVSAGTRTGTSGAFNDATVGLAANKNTFITVP